LSNTEWRDHTCSQAVREIYKAEFFEQASGIYPERDEAIRPANKAGVYPLGWRFLSQELPMKTQTRCLWHHWVPFNSRSWKLRQPICHPLQPAKVLRWTL